MSLLWFWTAEQTFFLEVSITLSHFHLKIKKSKEKGNLPGQPDIRSESSGVHPEKIQSEVVFSWLESIKKGVELKPWRGFDPSLAHFLVADAVGNQF